MASHSHGLRLIWAVGEEEHGRGRGMSQVEAERCGTAFPKWCDGTTGRRGFVTISAQKSDLSSRQSGPGMDHLRFVCELITFIYCHYNGCHLRAKMCVLSVFKSHSKWN